MIRLIFVMLFGGISALPVLAQNAADAYYDAAEMQKARAALKSSHGGQVASLILGERFEYQSNEGDSLTVWEGQGWIGTDEHKIWFKTEGEYENEENRFEEAEVQGLYSRAISPFWDLQFGLRHDVDPEPSRTYAVIGAQGLAPYWFELDGQLFVSEEGDVSARLEAEYELRFTQRLQLQPRIEVNAAFSSDEEIGVGSGLSTVAAGFRLRYEVDRQLVPYIGVSWSEAFGGTKDYVRDEGGDAGQVSWVAGIRFWF